MVCAVPWKSCVPEVKGRDALEVAAVAGERGEAMVEGGGSD